MTPDDVLQDELTRLRALWQVPDGPLTVEFSSRMTRSIGLAYPARGLIRIRANLREASESVLREVLCHELAHLVAFQRHGRVRPHGAEWQALMREAGYEPRVRWAGEALPEPTPRRRYLHVCPVCRIHRVARARMRRWRCVICREQGREGALLIEEFRDEL